MKKKFYLASTLALLSLIAVTYTQCGRNAHLYQGSDAEVAAVQSKVFGFQNFGAKTSVMSDDNDMYSLLWDGSDENFDLGDSYIPVNFGKSDKDSFRWISRCNQLEDINAVKKREKYISSVVGRSNLDKYTNFESSYELEKAHVKELALQRLKDIQDGKDLPLLIPVEYSLSTGDKHDRISYMAYRRSILRADHDGVSYIQAGSKKTYRVDSKEAKKDFVHGKMQYFSVVSVISEDDRGRAYPRYAVPSYDDFAAGQPFGSWNAYNLHRVGSGLGRITDIKNHMLTKNEAPIAKLYLADIRDEILPFDESLRIMYPDVASVGRNNEVQRRLKDIFDLKTIFRNRLKITAALSADREVTKRNYTRTYSGYEGVGQVLQRMNCDVGTSRIISARYTPIVLDLGSPYLRTTSEFWGTFFNLSNASFYKDDVKQDNFVETYTHRTAWIGGKISKVENPIRDTKGVKSRKRFMWQRVADDGFLILPPKSGEVTSVHLFGSEFRNPKNLDQKYENGFFALQDYAGTEMACNTPVTKQEFRNRPTPEQLAIRHKEIKDRYIGPWNDVYKELRIWVDKNVNGQVEDGELKTLEESGVMAINTCLTSINSIAEYDQYGNNTTLRSAFLYLNKDKKELDESDILQMLTFGKDKKGKEASFRTMIDIYFKARPYHFLERSLEYRSSSENKKFHIQIGDDIFTKDDSPSDSVLFN